MNIRTTSFVLEEFSSFFRLFERMKKKVHSFIYFFVIFFFCLSTLSASSSSEESALTATGHQRRVVAVEAEVEAGSHTLTSWVGGIGG